MLQSSQEGDALLERLNGLWVAGQELDARPGQLKRESALAMGQVLDHYSTIFMGFQPTVNFTGCFN